MPRYLAWAVAAAVLWLAMPGGIERAAFALLVSGAAALATALVLWARRSPHALPWRIACAGLCAVCYTHALELCALLGGPAAPVAARAADVAATGLILAAILLALYRSTRDRRPAALIDTAIVLVATALLSVFSMPAALVAVAGAAVLAARLGAHPPSLSLLLGAGVLQLAGTLPQTGGLWLDVPAVLVPALIAAAVLHPDSLRRHGVGVPPASPRPLRLVVLAGALLVNPVLVLAHSAGLIHGTVAALGVGVMTLLVLLRIGGLSSERERIRAAYLHSEQRFRALVQHAFDVIAVVDADGAVGYVSPSAGRVLGRAPAAFVGAPLPLLVAAQDATVVHAALDAVRAHPAGMTRVEVRLDQPDGGVRWGDVLLVNRLADPDVGGIVVNLRDVTERKLAELELSRLALHDPLTGLPNRVRLLERVAAAMEAGTPVAVLFCDLDGFKAVNDHHGHDLGDRLLVAVADRLREGLRGEDEATRLGGDEFVVLCSGLASEAHVVAIAARLRARLCEPFGLRGLEVRIGCSIGIAQADRPDLRPEALIEAADRAMYLAKQRRSGISVHQWSEDPATIPGG